MSNAPHRPADGPTTVPDQSLPATTGEVPFSPSQIPQKLTEYSQWVAWKTVVKPDREKPTKIPVSPDGDRASVQDSTTWGTFAHALRAVRTHAAVDGIGFVFTADDEFVGIDLDDCRNPDSGELSAWAADIVDQLDTYTEASPSGTGVHCLCEGTVPGDRNRRGDLECYDEFRYFTVTGRVLAPDYGATAIEPRQPALEDLYEQSLEDPEDGDTSSGDSSSGTESGTSGGPEQVTADDEEIIRRAKSAANGDKFAALWNGRWEGRFPSQSEADLALCDMLAFWTQKDRAQMDRLFRQSGLKRPKWDEDRGDQTYGELTLEKALRRIGDGEVYDPGHYSG
jgi:putative DNA primase/helicase